MAIEVKFRHNLARLIQDLTQYPGELMAASARAKNKSAVSAVAAAARDVQHELVGLKIGAIKRQMVIKKATITNNTASIVFTSKRFRVFGSIPITTVKTKQGTGVRIPRLPFRLELADGSSITAEQFRRMFVQRARSGKVNVWTRVGAKSRPIEAVVAPSLAHVFRERGVGARTLNYWRDRFQVVLEQEMKFRLGGR